MLRAERWWSYPRQGSWHGRCSQGEVLCLSIATSLSAGSSFTIIGVNMGCPDHEHKYYTRLYMSRIICINIGCNCIMIYSCGCFWKLIGNLFLRCYRSTDCCSLPCFYIWFVQNAGGATQDKAHDMAGAAKVRLFASFFCRFWFSPWVGLSIIGLSWNHEHNITRLIMWRTFWVNIGRIQLLMWFNLL
jgi:hypothetical protein